MEWHEIFPKEQKPAMEDIEGYIGGDAKALWRQLMSYMESAYNAKPKLTYSGCSGKPGWNVKFQKGKESFGTLYPEENSFSVLIVISYRLTPLMDAILPKLSPEIADLYRQAGDYMKLGKWMMFRISDAAGLEDYKNIISVKMAPKAE